MISMPMCEQNMFDVASRKSRSSQLGKKVGGVSMSMESSISARACILPGGDKAFPVPKKSTLGMPSRVRFMT